MLRAIAAKQLRWPLAFVANSSASTMESLKLTLLVLSCLHLIPLTAPALSAGNGLGRVVVPGGDVILPCALNTKESIVQMLFDWRKDGPKIQEVFMYDGGLHYNNGLPGQDEHFRGRVSHFPQELQFGNASIIIRNTTVADSGVYTCDFPRLQPQQIFNVELIVEPTLKDRAREIPGAVTKPLVGILNITNMPLLRCVVPGAFPKPEVQWQDSEGNILPSDEPQISKIDGRYYIALHTTVTKTKTNRFYCVVTQKEISHITQEEIYVPSCENLFKGTSGQVITGWLAGWFIGILSFGLVLAVLVATKKIIIYSNAGCIWSANKSSEVRRGQDFETGPEERSLNTVVCSPVISDCSLANYRNTDS